MASFSCTTLLCILYFFFSCYRDPWVLPSFPTRRSSDLARPRRHLLRAGAHARRAARARPRPVPAERAHLDRKSTRLNSSHTVISYAVFCLKKKNGLSAVIT